MTEKKKVSLAEAMKQKLAEKKGQGNSKHENGMVKKTQPMKSQMAKKPSNTRRKMGV